MLKKIQIIVEIIKLLTMLEKQLTVFTSLQMCTMLGFNVII